MNIINRQKIGHIIRLSWALALAKFKLRIAGKYLGVFWYVLEPLAFFLILLSLQSYTDASAISRYPAYLLLGLIMMNFFTGATTGAVKSIRESKHLVQSISIDQEVLPLSTVVQFCFSHVVEFAVFILILAYYGLFSWSILWYPFIFIVYASFVIGVSFLVAALGVFIEDLDNIWVVGSRLLWLGTPIFYAASPTSLLHAINRFNPIFAFMSIARDVVVYGSVPDASSVITAGFFTLAALIVGLWVFFRSDKRFGEFL